MHDLTTKIFTSTLLKKSELEYVNPIFTIIFLNTVDNIELFNVQIKNATKNHAISHSDWINNFYNQLGIGKFMLLELSLPYVKN